MPKTERLIELMMTVHTKRKFTAGELAAEFGVSYRTILRDLDELSGSASRSILKQARTEAIIC